MRILKFDFQKFWFREAVNSKKVDFLLSLDLNYNYMVAFVILQKETTLFFQKCKKTSFYFTKSVDFA